MRARAVAALSAFEAAVRSHECAKIGEDEGYAIPAEEMAALRADVERERIKAATVLLDDPSKVCTFHPASDEELCALFGWTQEQLEAVRAEGACSMRPGTVTVTSIDRGTGTITMGAK